MLASICVSLVTLSTGADVRLPRIFSDGMVMQRETDAPIWGWAAPGANLALGTSWTEAEIPLVADANGRWRATLRTLEAGGPHTVYVKTGDTIAVEVNDVWFGEVWLCSGQSNMEWTVAPQQWGGGVADWEATVRDSGTPRIAQFDVANAIALAPRDDVEGAWVACEPDSVGAFSATAYFFARELERELDMPIGLINATWGGTPAQAWTSREALDALDFYDRDLARLAELAANGASLEEKLREAQARWWKALEERDPGTREGWMRPDFDDASWSDSAQPGAWSDDGLDSFDGVAWMRCSVEVPSAWAGKPLALELGAIDDMDTTWFGGVRVGGTETGGQWRTPRRYEVPAELVRGGRALIAVRVVDTGGAGGLCGAPGDLALRLRDDAGAAPVSLAVSWRVRASTPLEKLGYFPSDTGFDASSPASLYNAMVAPLVPYAIRGAIWYQGESNRWHCERYEKLFEALIVDWRARFGRGDFPFYFVEIAPFRYANDKGESGVVRDAQRRVLGLPNTGMAVTTDIGDLDDIHPRNKSEVGRRLALWALAKTYGREGLAYSGPLYREMTIEGARARIHFDHVGEGLISGGDHMPFIEIAGADRKFVTARAEIDGETLVVWSPNVSAPVAVRYGFAADAQPILFNKAWLPAAVFRTDDWPLE